MQPQVQVCGNSRADTGPPVLTQVRFMPCQEPGFMEVWSAQDRTLQAGLSLVPVQVLLILGYIPLYFFSLFFSLFCPL